LGYGRLSGRSAFVDNLFFAVQAFAQFGRNKHEWVTPLFGQLQFLIVLAWHPSCLPRPLSQIKPCILSALCSGIKKFHFSFQELLANSCTLDHNSFAWPDCRKIVQPTKEEVG
jgi:hypothetical protein